MSSEHKTFPDEPNYNVGAALGFVAGLSAATLATIGVIDLPSIGADLRDWAPNFALWAVGGAIVGGAVGCVVDLVRK
jgi:lipoprotein signal peptidase